MLELGPNTNRFITRSLGVGRKLQTWQTVTWGKNIPTIKALEEELLRIQRAGSSLGILEREAEVNAELGCLVSKEGKVCRQKNEIGVAQGWICKYTVLPHGYDHKKKKKLHW